MAYNTTTMLATKGVGGTQFYAMPRPGVGSGRIVLSSLLESGSEEYCAYVGTYVLRRTVRSSYGIGASKLYTYSSIDSKLGEQ